ncbi:hypothetical protein NicSoilC5_40510 [Arthrobacter sp. NicSoilC5]|nr:hypothetical protein NicSoilC5_40510 [Arthrobacter sp. NicSoilC5]
MDDDVDDQAKGPGREARWPQLEYYCLAGDYLAHTASPPFAAAGMDRPMVRTVKV